MDVLLATGEQTTIALAAMALHALGVKAVSLTGAQAGIVTDGVHTKAQISTSRPKQVHELLDDGQHRASSPASRARPRTARSPPSAAAVPTSPPSPSPPRSRPISARSSPTWTASTPATRASSRTPASSPEISYDEMLEMASSGAKVMQSRSVEFAKKFGVVFEVRSSLQRQPRNHRVRRTSQHGKRRHPRRLHRHEPSRSHHHRHPRPARHVRAASSAPSPMRRSTST